MSRFGIQLKQRHDMKHMTHIATLALSVLLALTACERNRHTPEEDKVPLSFSALSQNTPTKADGTTTPFPHADFGVWGIARKNSNTHPYILWESDAMSLVSNINGNYHPASAAYWFSGYDYNFIAIAPYTNGAEKLSGFSVAPSHDALSFSFKMGYSNTNPGVNLMGAIAKTRVNKAKDQEPQELDFLHLTSKIDIKVKFEQASGEVALPLLPQVTGMRLENVDSDAAYSISYVQKGKIAINCAIGDKSDSDIPLTPTKPSNSEWWTVTTYILPQDVSDFGLYIDFTIGDEVYENFPITLTFPDDDRNYGINQWHIWNITLTPSLFVFFEPSVTDWAYGGQADEEIGFN